MRQNVFDFSGGKSCLPEKMVDWSCASAAGHSK
jgi:hypothetical protein